MLICPIATKNYVGSYVKIKTLNYTKYYSDVETCSEMQVHFNKIQKNAALLPLFPAKFHAFCDKTDCLTQYFEIFLKKLAKNTCKIYYYIVE